MEDIKIVVDAGHGGEDPGAVKGNIKEKDLTLMISKYMEEALKNAGFSVTMTRTADETLTKDERVRRIMNAYGNDPNVLVISNHINSTNDEIGPEGAETIYALRNDHRFAENILNEIAKEGQVIRSAYQRTLPNDSTKDYYFIHRETGVTTPVMIEYGFINNPQDLERIQTDYKDYVNAVVRAIKKTFENKDVVTYVVQNGDTLWSIANKFGVTVETLRRANGIYSDMLRVGQIIKIPRSSIMYGDEYMMYTVAPRDTLWSIAKRFNTTVDSIMIANGLTNYIIMVGQQLKIPTRNHIYIVRYGDSLWEIAQRYNTTVDNLKAMNNLTSNTIYIGQTLKVM